MIDSVKKEILHHFGFIVLARKTFSNHVLPPLQVIQNEAFLVLEPKIVFI
jgi:hypothetical protein